MSSLPSWYRSSGRPSGQQQSHVASPARIGYRKTPSLDLNHTSKKSSESSTPHAPRNKRPSSSTKADLLRQQQHQLQYGYLGKSDHVDLHSGLEPHWMDENSPPEHQHHVATRQQQQQPVVAVKQAWTTSHQPHTTPKMVQPFRRTVGRRAPQCVPLLDLSGLNEPDDKLHPIEIIDTHPNVATQRSMISWGGHDFLPTSTSTSAHGSMVDGHTDSPTGRDPCTVESIEDKPSERAHTPIVDKLPQAKGLKSNQLEFIEAKLLSHERAKPIPFASPHQVKAPLSLPGDPYSTTTALHPPPLATQTFLRTNMAVPEASITKRLRFEARILTQHGRDVHRELCGFFFLADNSITIYEYRQFGKKSSALPVIQRGSYNHLIGHRKGTPLEINFIKKGSVIHFRCSEHPGLPSNLKSRPLVAIMITSVDEKAKKDLLCEGRNPVEYHSIETYLNAGPPPEEEKDRLLLSTLQGMLCSRLKGRARKTLVGVGRDLKRLSSVDGIVSFAQLQQTLRKYHLCLTVEDMDLLCHLLVAMEMTPPTESGLYADCCVSSLVGYISEDRLALVRSLFHRLDVHKSGSILLDDVNKFFNKRDSVTVSGGQRSGAQVWEDLLECLFGTATSISYADLEHYYLGVSIETPSDSEFYTLLRHCWTI